MKVFHSLTLLIALAVHGFCADALPGSTRAYVLGPDDSLLIKVADLAEFDAKTGSAIRVDHQGEIRLPIIGRIKAEGLTVDGLEKEIAKQLSTVMNNPEVTAAVVEYRSHPISVLGAVRNPGVYQVTGQKTLFEVLSLAGGLNPDASNRIKITRAVSEGPLPLPNATGDKTGEFYVGELNVRSVMEATNPEENIAVRTNDVITVPKAEMVYVVGSVHKAGGFPLLEKERMSVLQAVSLAEGLDKVANAKNARILRHAAPGEERQEVAVDVEKIFAGRAEDVTLQANDILFVPNSLAKSTTMRAIEAAIQVGTGIAIWGR